MFINYIFKENEPYKTINDVLKTEYKMSNRLLSKLIKNNNIYLNGSNCDTRTYLNPNDTVTIDLNYEEQSENIVPTKMNLDIIYEDKWLLIINKPSGIAIHPSIAHFKNSLSNGIQYYFNSINLKKKIRPVNRLDLDTSGIVIFAKCEYIQEDLSKQMQNGFFKKDYLCVVENTFDNNEGIINSPIARKQDSIIERCIDKNNGQPAITYYKVLNTYNNYSLVKCSLKTGRTHQIRVHMSSINHPLLGDTLYGKSSSLISRQALHSYYISFIHPVSKKSMEFICDVPYDIKKLL